MVIGAQGACTRFVIGETALNLAKSAFVHGVSADGEGFSWKVSRHDSVYHARKFKKKTGKATGI